MAWLIVPMIGCAMSLSSVVLLIILEVGSSIVPYTEPGIQTLDGGGVHRQVASSLQGSPGSA